MLEHIYISLSNALYSYSYAISQLQNQLDRSLSQSLSVRSSTAINYCKKNYPGHVFLEVLLVIAAQICHERQHRCIVACCHNDQQSMCRVDTVLDVIADMKSLVRDVLSSHVRLI
jgi:hypothetical protein